MSSFVSSVFLLPATMFYAIMFQLRGKNYENVETVSFGNYECYFDVLVKLIKWILWDLRWEEM